MRAYIVHQSLLAAGKARAFLNQPEHLTVFIGIYRRLRLLELLRHITSAGRQSRRAKGYSGYGDSPPGHPPQAKLALDIPQLGFARRTCAAAFALETALRRLVPDAVGIGDGLPHTLQNVANAPSMVHIRSFFHKNKNFREK